MRSNWVIPSALSALIGVGTTTSLTLANDYSWNAAGQSNWNTGGNWSPVGVPGSGDNVVTPTQFAGMQINVATATVTNWTYAPATSDSHTVIGLNGASGATLTITGTLTKSGTGTLTFRNGANNPLMMSVGSLSLTQGSLDIGAFNTDTQPVTSLTIGSASISGTTDWRLNVTNVSGNRTTVTGNLALAGTSNVYIRQRQDTSGILSVGSLTSTDTTPNIRANNFSSAASTATLQLNNASGVATYAGRLQISASSNAANSMSVVKEGAGTQVFSGILNTYNGGTTINEGALLLNNASASGTGTGAITVTDGGTLGGLGRVAPTGANAISIGANGSIAPGSVLPGATIESFEIALGSTSGGVTFASGAALDYELGAAGLTIASPGAADSILITGAAAGDVSFAGAVFDFQGTGAKGWYKLLDTDLAAGTTWSGLVLSGQQITGGLSVTNLTSGLTGTLFVGDGTVGHRDDIYLQVVPEPASLALLALTGTLLLRRKHH